MDGLANMDNWHKVAAGDTLLRIARSYRVNETSILAANPQLNALDYLVPGSLLLIPQRLFEPAGLCGERTDGDIGSGIVDVGNSNGNDIVDMSAEYGFRELEADIARLQSVYPFLTAETIGQSVMGKPIYSLSLGKGPREIHVNGAVHANEWVTSAVLMKFMERAAASLAGELAIGGINASRLFSTCCLRAIPMVNPDGVELSQEGSAGHPLRDELLRMNGGSGRFHRWKANIRGIDLNDQFPAYWSEEAARRGVAGPGPRDYGGSAPLTEPEALALADYTRRKSPALVLSFHAQGREIYWNYRGLEPADSTLWADRFARVSGYRAVRLEGSDAGFKDWFIYEFGRPGFTVEVGWGMNPLPVSQCGDICEEVLAIIVEALREEPGAGGEC